MPFIELPGSKYLRRERHYVDSTDTEETSRVQEDRFRVVSRFNKRLYYVQSVEVTDYNLPASLASTFYAKTIQANGNNLLDLRLTKNLIVSSSSGFITVDPPIASEDFTIELPVNLRITSGPQLAEILQTEINTAFAAATTPALTNAVVSIAYRSKFLAEDSFTAEQGVLDFFDIEFTGEPTYTGTISLLFGTGPNKDDSPALVLGFPPGLDTLVDTTPTSPYLSWNYANVEYRNLRPVSLLPLLLDPLRYIDIRVQELEPSIGLREPLCRVYNSSPIYVSNNETTPTAPRLLTTPLPYADSFVVILTTQEGRKPNASAALGWDVVFDMVLVSPEVCVPSWVRERLMY